MTDFQHKHQFDLKRIEDINILPTLPHVANEVMNLIDRQYVSAARLAKVITQDQGMVAKILSLANSPVYGLARKVSTIEMAIVVLGFDAIKELVISLSILNSTYTRNDKYFNSAAFGKHALLSGLIAKMLASDFGYRVSGEAFIAGLLHDVGISTMQKYLNTEFKLISELRFYKKLKQHEAENIVIGKTHSEIGSHLAEKWNFPNHLVDSIHNHHTPQNARVSPLLTSIIHVADYVANLVGEPFLLIEESESIDDSVVEVLKLPDKTYLDDIVRNYCEVINSNFEEYIDLSVKT